MINSFRRFFGYLQNRKVQKVLSFSRLQLLSFEDRIVPATFTVLNTNDSGPDSLRQAIIDANNTAGNDQINFNFSSGSSSNTITLVSALPSIVSAGIAGTVTINGLGASSLTINGNNGNFRIFSINVGGDLTISGVTVTGANSGAFSNFGSLAISNSTISGNTASNGGAIFNRTNGTDSSTLAITNSTISNNTSNGAGGGIYARHLSSGSLVVTITNSIFSNNTTGNSGSGNGGGIYNSAATFEINGSTFSNNSTLNAGGAICSAGPLTISNSTISGNIATNGAGIQNDFSVLNVFNSTISGNNATTGGSKKGGGIYNNAGTLTISNSTISGNSSSIGAGIHHIPNGSLNVVNTSIQNNTASASGGAIWTAGIFAISNSILSGNSANLGGGIFSNSRFSSPSNKIYNCTLSGNSATSGGGGIYSNDSRSNITVTNCTLTTNSSASGGGINITGGTLYIANTIIANNSATTGPDFTGNGTVNLISPSTSANNLVTQGTFTWATTKTSSEINLGTLQNNGGPTQTVALLSGSVAIGAANSTISNATPVLGLDQRGYTRSASVPSIGAYEFNGIAPSPTVTLNTANITSSVTTLTITGSNYSSIAANNTVSFNNGAVGSVNTATPTQLTVNLTTPPTTAGILTAVVTTNNVNSGTPVQVATVIPTITLNTTNQLINAATLTINGTGFSTTPGNNAVTLNNGAVGSVSSATSTQLTVNLTTPPTIVGNLTAVVITNGASSGAPVQVANILNIPNNPTFGTSTSTTDGFNVQITNYDSNFIYGGTVTLGLVSISNSGLVSVTGVSANTSSTATITTTRTNYASGSAQVTASSLLISANIPIFGTPTSTADGFEVQIINYNSNFNYVGTVTVGSVSISNSGLVSVTGVLPNTSSTATITTTRTNYASGSGQVTATSMNAPLLVTGTSKPTASAGFSTVNLYDPVTGEPSGTAVPFPGFNGPVKVVSGDFNNDGFADIVAGAGVGGGPAIAVLDSKTGQVIEAFFAFDPSFTGGVFVGVQDVNSDGILDIIAGAGPGGGPEVRIFNGNNLNLIRAFYAYDQAFTGGVSIASIDFNNDGILDLITGAGPGGAPHVKVFDGATNAVISQWFAYPISFTGGVFVAVGDIGNDGDIEVVTGAGPTGAPVVAVWNPFTGALLSQFMAYSESFTGGVRVGVSDGNGDGTLDLLTGAGPGGGPEVKVFSFPALDLLFSFYSGEPTNTGGVYVG